MRVVRWGIAALLLCGTDVRADAPGGAAVASIPGGNVLDLAWDPDAASTVYAAVSGSGVFRSSDDGATWTQIFLPAIANHTTGPVLPSARSEVVLVADQLAGVEFTVVRSVDGTTFTGVVPRAMGRATALAEGNADGVFYAGLTTDFTNEVGLWKSTDGGATWTRLGDVGPPGHDVKAILELPGGRLVVGTGDIGGSGGFNPVGRLYYSDDGGAVWSEVPGLTERITGLAFNGSDRIVASSTNNASTFLSTSADGKTWNLQVQTYTNPGTGGFDFATFAVRYHAASDTFYVLTVEDRVHRSGPGPTYTWPASSAGTDLTAPAADPARRLEDAVRVGRVGPGSDLVVARARPYNARVAAPAQRAHAADHGEVDRVPGRAAVVAAIEVVARDDPAAADVARIGQVAGQVRIAVEDEVVEPVHEVRTIADQPQLAAPGARRRTGGEKLLDAFRADIEPELEFHHEEPFGKGGAHTVDNVRLVRRAHNGHLAERDYGKGAHMQRFRSRAQEAPARYPGQNTRGENVLETVTPCIVRVMKWGTCLLALALSLALAGCTGSPKGSGGTYSSPKNCSSAYPSGILPGQNAQLSIRYQVSAQLGQEFKDPQLAHGAMPRYFTQLLNDLAAGTGTSFVVADGTRGNLLFEMQVRKDEGEHLGVNIIVWGTEHLGSTGTSPTVVLFVFFLETLYVSEEKLLGDLAGHVAQRILHGWTC